MERLVSVIMPCYRESVFFFKTAVESILRQTYRNLELILILDDPDNLGLQQEGMQYAETDSRVRFYVNERNLKLAATLNRGLELAEGEFIARLDADDIAMPARIEKQMALAEEYDLISTNFAFINDQGNIVRHRHFPTQDKDIKRHLKNVADCMYHTTWLGKKRTFTCLGGYRDIGPFEDYDLLLRAVKKDMKLFNLHKELTYYRINTAGISYNNRIRQHLGSEYIRNHWESVDDITKKDIDMYLASDVGIEHAKAYKEFCSVKQRFLFPGSTVDYLKILLFYAPYLSIFNYYGRKIWLDFFRTAIAEHTSKM